MLAGELAQGEGRTRVRGPITYTSLSTLVCIRIYKRKPLLLYLTFDLALALECEASFWLENIEDIHVKGENNELILSPI